MNQHHVDFSHYCASLRSFVQCLDHCFLNCIEAVVFGLQSLTIHLAVDLFTALLRVDDITSTCSGCDGIKLEVLQWKENSSVCKQVDWCWNYLELINQYLITNCFYQAVKRLLFWSRMLWKTWNNIVINLNNKYFWNLLVRALAKFPLEKKNYKKKLTTLIKQTKKKRQSCFPPANASTCLFRLIGH